MNQCVLRWAGKKESNTRSRNWLRRIRLEIEGECNFAFVHRYLAWLVENTFFEM